MLSYLTTSDILAMRNIGLAVMEKMSAPELQIYQARQVYEEALHTWTYQHCIESLGLDQKEIYNRYRVVPEIHGKIALANRRLERVMRSDFDLTDRDNLHEFAPPTSSSPASSKAAGSTTASPPSSPCSAGA